jgi:hypothetical protein
MDEILRFQHDFDVFAGFVSFEGFKRVSQRKNSGQRFEVQFCQHIQCFIIRIRGGRDVTDGDFFGVGVGYRHADIAVALVGGDPDNRAVAFGQ